MIRNIEEIDDGHSFSCDVCIVGAGAAGISLALELDRSGLSVILLEGGGLEPPGAQGRELYTGESVGRGYQVQTTRLRFFGGTTNHWGGWCRPMDDIDFERRPAIAHSGWPMTRQELAGHYTRAARLCQIDNFDQFENFNNSEADSLVCTRGSTVLENRHFVFSPPTRFGQAYLKSIESSTNVDCYLNANVSELLFENGQIRGVKVKTFNQKEFSIPAGRVVLAMGGLENARFLLTNSKQNREMGIPNGNDLIGRFFMDHLGVWPGYFLLRRGLKYFRHQGHAGLLMPLLSLSGAAIQEHGLINIGIMLEPKKPDKVLGENYFDNRFMGSDKEGSLYQIRSVIEPTPYRHSRVTLSDKLDALGSRKLKLDWQINPEDFPRIERTYALITRELGVSRSGRARLMNAYIESVKEKTGYGSHHMGTTRMGTDRQTSVTNSFGELHEVKNLFVAGSSIFPTAGFSNPTLTIVALAVRLADHLKAQSI